MVTIENEIKILQPQDSQVIEQLELQLSPLTDEVERELQSWSSPWREESLNHYLPLGWSFGLWREDLLQAYLLAQPLLFFRGFSQNLWVEHLAHTDLQYGKELLKATEKWAKSKHLQNLLIPKEYKETADDPAAYCDDKERSFYQIPTARYI